jgi:hypothetical protein
MVQGMSSYYEVTMSSFSRAHWQGRESNHSFVSSAEIVTVWSKAQQNLIRWFYLYTGLNPLEIFRYANFFKFSHEYVYYNYSYTLILQIRTVH